MYKYIYYDLTLESIIKWYQCGVILDAESANMGLIIDNIDVFFLGTVVSNFSAVS